MNMCYNVNTSFLMQNPNDPTMLSEWRRVAFVENFFGILEEVHCREKGHIGQKKTDRGGGMYESVTTLIVQVPSVTVICTLLSQVSKMYECLPSKGSVRQVR